MTKIIFLLIIEFKNNEIGHAQIFRAEWWFTREKNLIWLIKGNMWMEWQKCKVHRGLGSEGAPSLAQEAA